MHAFIKKNYLIIPFISYWIFSIGLNFLGKFKPMYVDFTVYIFIFICLFSFYIGYMSIRKHVSFDSRELLSYDVDFIRKWAGYIYIAVISGYILLIADRLLLGISFSFASNSMHEIRSRFNEQSTIITTLAVIPSCFNLIFVAVIFYIKSNNLKVSRYTNLAIVTVIALGLINMYLSANRGFIVEVISFFVLYFACFSRGNLINIKRVVYLVVIVAISFNYFAYVADNRADSRGGDVRDYEAANYLKNPGDESLDGLYSEYQLQYYFTHGLTMIDKTLSAAPYLNYDLISMLGVRVESQIKKISPSYQSSSKLKILNELDKNGGNIFGWPTAFIFSAYSIGIILTPLVFFTLGVSSKAAILGFFAKRSLQSIVFVVLIYYSLNLSYDWFVRDFSQIFAFVFAAVFLNGRKIRVYR